MDEGGAGGAAKRKRGKDDASSSQDASSEDSFLEYIRTRPRLRRRMTVRRVASKRRKERPAPAPEPLPEPSPAAGEERAEKDDAEVEKEEEEVAVDLPRVRPAFFCCQGKARNPSRAPLAKMKAALGGQGGQAGVLLWRKFEAAGAWGRLHQGHFDWWMFPIDDGSNARFNVYAGDVAELQADRAYMAGYREGVRLALAAWGWDAAAAAPIVPVRGGMGWTQWDVRLAKICRSLYLFEEAALLASAQAFARSVKPRGGFSYGHINLDELLAFRLPRA